MTNNKQQTALEIFWNQLPEILPFTVDTETAVKLQKAYQQAKEIEKQQIAKAFDDGDYNYHYSRKTGDDFENGKEYYQEVYGKEI
jgi:hypothetical protein